MNSEAPNASARQFAAVREIAATLGAVEVPFWLRGGWALDFLLGRITREHADIDLVGYLEHRDLIYESLVSAGFAYERELPHAAIDFTKNGESIQFALVEFAKAGVLVTRGFESWPWPVGALDGPVRAIDGVACRTLSVHALLEEKESYEKHRGSPPRDKDRASMELLRQLLRNES